MPEKLVSTKWISFENRSGEKGAGGFENKGAKGHAFEHLKAGKSVNLVNYTGSGVINKIWLTISDNQYLMTPNFTL